MLLPTTLSMTAAAVVLNLWLSMRIGKLRVATKIEVGDGGNDLMLRRMRAQENFVENVPLTLLLAALIEFAGKGGNWLHWVLAAYMIARIAHAIGMDHTMDSASAMRFGRGIGFLISMLVQLALAVIAVLVVLGRM